MRRRGRMGQPQAEYVGFDALDYVMEKAHTLGYTVTLDLGRDGHAEVLICNARNTVKTFDAPTASQVLRKVNHWLNTRGSRG